LARRIRRRVVDELEVQYVIRAKIVKPEEAPHRPEPNRAMERTTMKRSSTMLVSLLTAVAAFISLVGPGRMVGDPAASSQLAAELVQPGVISTDGGEIFPALSPDGQTLYFNTHLAGWSSHRLMMSRLGPDGWGEPEMLPFSGVYNDRAPRPSPDGRVLFFSSDRPLPGASRPRGDFNLWTVELMDDGSWGEPQPLPPPVTTEADEWHSSLTADGTLYFSSRNRPDSHGFSDLYRARFDGESYSEPENLGSPFNDRRSQSDVYVGPDGSFMVFVITDHPEGFGGDDLWASFFRDGVWTDPVNLGPEVNTSQYEYGPAVSPDGRYLYFSSHRRGLGDIYRIQLSELEVELLP
jgi:hypothetical protein